MTESNRQGVQIELAKERNRIAADRTLLSWVRTSVSFIGLGFAIGQIFAVLEMNLRSQVAADLAVKLMSLLFTGLGVFMALTASLDYQTELRQLQQPGYHYRSRPSLGLLVGGSIAIASVIAFVMLW